ncbi:MAG: (2Fe-2S)-binding protein [Dermatophilaceae bacterium]
MAPSHGGGATPLLGHVAEQMSRRHPWLHFSGTGPALPHRLEPDTEEWQRDLHGRQLQWYGGNAPPQVASAFVLQWLLQVPAHTAAQGAAHGPWRSLVTGLSFALGSNLVPEVVRLTSLEPDDAPLASRLDHAGRDYRAVAIPLAHAFRSLVRLGPRTRTGMVDDMWAEARRAAEMSAGVPAHPEVPARASCCLLYALPDCAECAGCPRRRRPRISR